MICAASFHDKAVSGSAPKIAAAGDDADLASEISDLPDGIRDAADGGAVDALSGAAGKSFAADLDHNAFVSGNHNAPSRRKNLYPELPEKREPHGSRAGIRSLIVP